MKFSINKDDLHDALATVAAIIPTRTTLPILSNLLLELEGNRLRLTATDLDLYVVRDIDAEGVEDGVVTVSGRRFSDIVRELPSEQLTISTEEEQTTLNCGRRVYRFLGMPATDFPSLPAALTGSGADLPVVSLLRALQHTTFAVSTDDARPNLQGALLQLTPKGTHLVASDSHRLVRYDLPQIKGEGLEVIIPLKTLQLLQRTLDTAEGNSTLELAGNFVGLTYGRTRVYSRVLDGPFPNYEKVIPTDNSLVLKLDRDEMIHALRRVRVLCSTQSQQVRLALEAGALSISTNTPEVGDAIETLSTEYDDEPMEIAFNALYLLDVLRHIDCNNIVMRLGGPTRAGLIEPSEGPDKDNYMCLIMPLRLYSV